MTENSLSGIAFIVHGTQLVYAFPLLMSFVGCLGMTAFVIDGTKLQYLLSCNIPLIVGNISRARIAIADGHLVLPTCAQSADE